MAVFRLRPLLRRARPWGWTAASSLLVFAACSKGTVTGDVDDSPPADDQASTGGANSDDTGVDPDLPDTSKLPRGRARPGGAFVHLFEWKWADVARECETFLGPRGFAAVQISPSSAHAVLPNQPWYERYQPAGYELESRSGNRADFVDMVQRCDAAGVDIYVDAVINHMTAQPSGTNSAGRAFTKYEYEGLYTASDFHQPTCSINPSVDYANNADNVRNCELVGLADLDTAQPSVRQKIADYLVAYVELGVKGFRVDAAKHMAVADVTAIVQLVSDAVGTDDAPYYFLEVIDNGAEAISSSEYLGVSGTSGSVIDITEFKYEGAARKFLASSGETLASLADVTEEIWGLLPSDRAVVFTNNHDTQRNAAVYYQDGSSHDLANVFLLAWPYGYPQLMSSYAFSRSNTAQGPPADAAGHTNAVYSADSDEPDCLVQGDLSQPVGWVCEHRSLQVAQMVAFRLATAGAQVTNFWSNEHDQIAFARAAKGFVVINGEQEAMSQTLSTSLAAGVYCDLLSGGRRDGVCLGKAITVDEAGSASFEVPALTAVALTTQARRP